MRRPRSPRSWVVALARRTTRRSSRRRTMVSHDRHLHGAQAPVIGTLPAHRRLVGEQPGSVAGPGRHAFQRRAAGDRIRTGREEVLDHGGLPGGLGFDVYPPGQKLTIYLQKMGFASGTPSRCSHLRSCRAVSPRPRRRPSGACAMRAWARARAGRKRRFAGAATFTYAGREYTLPLDVAAGIRGAGTVCL